MNISSSHSNPNFAHFLTFIVLPILRKISICRKCCLFGVSYYVNFQFRIPVFGLTGHAPGWQGALKLPFETVHSIALKAIYIFNTQVTKVLSLPLKPKGVPWNPPKKTTFPLEFFNEIPPCMYAQLNIIILQIFFLNVVPFQNGGKITDLCFASFRF